MRFIVPKFIERESKIIGPLSLRQFAYVGIAGTICFAIYFIAPIQYFIFSVIIFGSTSLALAFVKINGRNLSIVIVNAVKFTFAPKEYLWEKKKITSPIGLKKEKPLEEVKKEKYKLRMRGLPSNLNNKIDTK